MDSLVGIFPPLSLSGARDRFQHTDLVPTPSVSLPEGHSCMYNRYGADVVEDGSKEAAPGRYPSTGLAGRQESGGGAE